MTPRGSSPGRRPPRPAGDHAQPDAQKRAAVRLRLPSLRADIWVLEAARCRQVACRVLNISEGGALVEARGPLDDESQVYCRIALPKGPQIEHLARVVRLEVSSGNLLRVGLKFEGMSLPRRDQLVRWIFGELANRRR